jgi:hypothetical protein
MMRPLVSALTAIDLLSAHASTKSRHTRALTACPLSDVTFS